MASESPASLMFAPGRPVTLVDSSVILDIVTDDPAGGQWSEDALARAGDEGQLGDQRDRVRGGLGRL